MSTDSRGSSPFLFPARFIISVELTAETYRRLRCLWTRESIADMLAAWANQAAGERAEFIDPAKYEDKGE